MVKQNVFKKIVFIAALLFLVKVLSCRVADISQITTGGSCPKIEQTEHLHQEEMSLFMAVMQDYVAHNFHKKVSLQSLENETDVSKVVPWYIKSFLELYCFDTNRFYYVQRRMQTVMKVLYLKSHTDSVIAALEEYKAAAQDAEQVAWYQDMIETQKKIAQIEGVTKEELEFAQMHQNQLESLLK